MKRIVKMLGLAVVLTAFVAVSITGAAFAAGGNTTDNGNQGEVCPNSDCVPNLYEWDYAGPGPHGNGTALAMGGNTTDNGNQGEECPNSDCVPNLYESPGPHGAQNGKVSH